MQKKSNKASILIWSIFLSLILIISFISVSNKINSILEIVKSLENNNDKSILIENSIKNSNKNQIKIDENTKIIIQNKILNKTLKKNEEFEIYFPSASTGTLKLTNLGIFHYKFNSDNGFLKANNTEYNFNNQTGVLKLVSYSGIASFKLISNNKFEFSGKNYKMIRKIGNKKIIEQNTFLK